MADCYIVRRGGAGGGKSTFDITNKDFLLSMTENWLFAKENGFTTNGYIIFPDARVCGSFGSNTVGISVKFNYPTDFNILTDVITTYTGSTMTTEYRLNNPNKLKAGDYTYWNRILNWESVYISENVECIYPEIKKHFGKWHDYKSLRYIDIVKLPPKMNDDVFTDFVIFTQNYNGKKPKIWGINNVKELYIDRVNKHLCFRAEYCYGWTYSATGYDPSMSKDRENRDDNLHSDLFTVDGNEIVNYIAYTTHDILYEDGTLAMKANCTLDEVIQKE